MRTVMEIKPTLIAVNVIAKEEKSATVVEKYTRSLFVYHEQQPPQKLIIQLPNFYFFVFKHGQNGAEGDGVSV